MASTVMRRALGAVLGMGAFLGIASPVAAHTLNRLESPLPLIVYLSGAGAAVALSFLFVLFRDTPVHRNARTRTALAPRSLVLGLRAVGLIAWCWIVAQVLVGGSSLADVASLFLWVYGWVGLALVSAFVGPVWTWLDPFATIHMLASSAWHRLGLPVSPPAPLPVGWGIWPAVAGLAFIIWLELVYRGGGLGVILILYTLLSVLGMTQFGRDAWRERGEIFSVWFGTLGRLAPYALAGPPGSRLLRRQPFLTGLFGPGWTRGHLVLIALGTGSILYDGLSQTQPWFDLFGLPGVPIATVEWAAFMGTIVAVVLGAGRLVSIAAAGAGLLPIAVGYLVAHYLTYLLSDGPRIVVAISDPFQLGWDLFGTAFFEPSSAWVPASVVWTVQLVAVVGGHIAGAWAGHLVAARTFRSPRELRVRQLPLAAMMVGLTTLTLWSLGQAVVKEPAPAPAPPVSIISGLDR